jgi:glyoxylase-like metal-dependent hydrolase (beta-lactamase superfamily II)
MPDEFFRFRMGDFECLTVSDGDLGYAGTADIFFTNAPPADLDRSLQKYRLSPGCVPVSWTCLLIDTGKHRILVDTGSGPDSAPAGGNVFANLVLAGVHPTAIDVVIFTHGHADHAGGGVDANGQPAYPNAQYKLSRLEWEHWEGKGERDKYLAPLADRLELLDGEAELLPGLRVHPAGGHTPGHLVVEVESRGSKLFALGDLLLHPLHVEHPEWYTTIDSDPAGVVATRKRWLAAASREKALVQTAHLAFPGLGHIHPAGRAQDWHPLEIESGEVSRSI